MLAIHRLRKSQNKSIHSMHVGLCNESIKQTWPTGSCRSLNPQPVPHLAGPAWSSFSARLSVRGESTAVRILVSKTKQILANENGGSQSRDLKCFLTWTECCQMMLSCGILFKNPILPLIRPTIMIATM